MPSRRPSRSRFMGADYRVRYVENLKDEDCWGLTDHENTEISIVDSLKPDVECEVLIHEALHQMLNRSGIEMSARREEALVGFLGGAIAGHVGDNPEFWRYILRQKAR